MRQLRKISTFALLLLLALGSMAQEKTTNITLNDIYKKGVFRQQSVYGLRSMEDGAHYTTLEEGREIVKYAYKTGEAKETIFSLDEVQADFSYFSNYQFSADENKILIQANTQPIYRHSFTATFYIYNRKSGELSPLSVGTRQQLAFFSPNGEKVAFVRDNNLFYKDLKAGKEVQVTNDGKYNHIINGTTDWVYEEEFAITKGLAWSPESDKIAFYKFDESHVKEFNMNMFNRELYPINYSFKYPKAGERNAIVTLHIYNLEDKETKKVDTGDELDQYLPRMKWTQDNNQLAVIRMNRLQNHLDILLADAETGNTEVLYSETNKYYISQIGDDYPTFLEDGEHFVINSEKDGYNHFYLYNMQGKLVNQITKGQWEATELLGIDDKKERLYYISAQESPLQRAVYAIDLDGSNKEKLSTKEGANRAVFSNGFKYYINYYSNANTPNYITLHNKKGELIRVLEDNKALQENIDEYGFTKKEFFTINTPSSNWDLNAYMIKPANFDENKEYPLFMFLYGGPGSQQVLDSWSSRMSWFQMLAQQGYLVVCVDNRGTGARGEEFKKMTYGQLGKYETIDQIEAAEYLSSLPYVDADRTGIFGWSYGGFMSSSCLFKGNDVFEMAIAVAPVTNWRFYDTIYTERFMGLPQDNADGYDDNSPINFSDKLKGDYLLIHGTGDDNVHVQNAIELIEQLVQENKQFEMQFYPDKNHGIYGGNTSLHLYTRMTNFIKENL
ncbi:MAG: S9 family peptidase [Bacteroidales bacterium]